jgi:hypothetical protein
MVTEYLTVIFIICLGSLTTAIIFCLPLLKKKINLQEDNGIAEKMLNSVYGSIEK